jgi:hypothetical protein
MWSDRDYLRRLVPILEALTQRATGLDWLEDAEDEPGRLKAIFPDGMVHLIPSSEGRPLPDLVVFGPWGEVAGTLPPDNPDDAQRIKRLYQLAEKVKLDGDVDYWEVFKGKTVGELEQIHRDIAKELTRKPAGSRSGV